MLMLLPGSCLLGAPLVCTPCVEQPDLQLELDHCHASFQKSNLHASGISRLAHAHCVL